MRYSDEELSKRVLARDFRAVARMITRIETGSREARALAAGLRRNSSLPGRAHVVGITGAPGAGKSTLVDQLTLHLEADLVVMILRRRYRCVSG